MPRRSPTPTGRPLWKTCGASSRKGRMSSKCSPSGKPRIAGEEIMMRPSVAIGAVLLALSTGVAVSNAAGETQYEKIVQGMLAKVEDITKILTTIRDSDTAKTAQPQLKEAASKMMELRKQADAVDQPTKEEKDRLAKEYAPKMEAAVKKLRAETIRVKGIPGGDEALAELKVL